MTAATDARTQAATDASRPLAPDELRLIDAYWRPANFGGPDLPDGQPTARRAAGSRAHQAAAARARAYTREHGEDSPEISGWTWPL